MKGIANYCKAVTERNVEEGSLPAVSTHPLYATDASGYRRLDQGNRSVEPMHSHLKTLMTSDGSPAVAIARMQDAGELPDVYNFPGGFHTALEGWRMLGRLCRDCHSQLLFSYWRPTAGKQEYVLQPSDPRQVEEESAELLIAHYAAAIRATAKHYKSNQVSVKQVEDYMVMRASQHAAVLDVLIAMRVLEVLMLMHESECQDGFDQYLQSRRLLTLLMAATHATNYVRLNTTDDMHWLQASDAEKAVQQEFVYLQKTRTPGVRIWGDRHMEWIVRDIRFLEGKHWIKGKEKSVTDTTQRLPELVLMRLFGKNTNNEVYRADARATEQSESHHGHSIKLGRVYCAASLGLDRQRVWDEVPLHKVSRKPLPPHHCLADKPLSIPYLRWPHEAVGRVTDYAAAYCIPSSPRFRQVDRSEYDVSLSHIKPLREDELIEQRHEHARWTETSVDVLEGRKGGRMLMTRETCIQELDQPQSRAAKSSIPALAVLKTMSKRELAELVSATRIMRFAQLGGVPQFTPNPYDASHVQAALPGAIRHKFILPSLAGCVWRAEHLTAVDTTKAPAQPQLAAAENRCSYLRNDWLGDMSVEDAMDGLDDFN